ncbi:hypothetical protein PILCRDRAFT_15225 [Piloderma croceum F 1598]|uniref:HNH nuclease domain-containing protein n=1 Tax=Piloderma croceum (strain F 1598) TaxID=765440 RepID=A0A0C3AHY6_PILCF|nr:hypothetical protein PILCRDRAFT_15225 [Piloderma croceum F 1598]
MFSEFKIIVADTINRTPTLDETHTHLVILRDGYRCAVTGHYDTEHPKIPEDEDETQVDLLAAHILRRAIAVFKGTDNNSDEVRTFLRNYADLRIESIEDIANIIDDPSNGLALEANAHNGFDRFRWSLKQTENPNEYTTVIYEKRGHGLLKPGAGRIVRFTDHSRDFREPSSPRKRTRTEAISFDLPNPLFIRIHCAST